jgi:RNA polymerase sigma factor (sigma-70 family)
MRHDITNRLLKLHDKAFNLSVREKQLLEMSKSGKTTKQIAEELGLKPTTIRVTLCRAREKESLL